MTPALINSIHSFLSSLSVNEATLVAALIGLIGTLAAATIAVRVAFNQLAKQLEHRSIYEGWRDLQSRLFEFSSALREYRMKVLLLLFMIHNRSNPLLNHGNEDQFVTDAWHGLSNAHLNASQAYTEFLRSYESNEILFQHLAKMKRKFQAEYRRLIGDVAIDFEGNIFPEIRGQRNTLSDNEKTELINKFANDIAAIETYVNEDFRIELQNSTVGLVFKKTIPYRKPNPGFKILTRKGLKRQNVGFLTRISKIVRSSITRILARLDESN